MEHSTIDRLGPAGPLSIRAAGPTDWHAATALLHEYVEWMTTATAFDPLVEQPGLATELDDVAAHYSNPDAVPFTAWFGDRAIGTLAVIFHSGGGAELKRMYVRANARGSGVADALLAEAIGSAVRRRCTHVWLETIRGSMDAAIAVYRRHGFRAIEHADPTLAIAGVVVMRRHLDSF